MDNLFARLAAIDCSEHIERKGNFSYVSWSWAWQMLKEQAPEATFEKHLFENLPYMECPDGYAFVMVTVTAEGQSATEILPVLNHSNKPVKNPDSFAINTSLQRCLVKAIAFHGLGLYIYAGEDLPPSVGVVSEPAADEQMQYLEELCRELDKPFSEAQKWLRDNDNNISFLVGNLEANLKKREAS